jgi:mRNA interferase MazF
MPSTTTYNRGDVVLVPFPFTDLASVKQRPALVVSPDSLNRSRPDVLVIAITSQVPAVLASDEISVPAGELYALGLPKPSILKLTKMFSIHQGLILKKLGIAPQPTLGLILRRLQQQFEL